MATWAAGHPTLDQRRAERSARVAFFASIVKEYERLFAGMPFEERDWHVHAMCNACGLNTANWCDSCEGAGRTFVNYHGMVCAGSPLCSQCEDHVPCQICGA